MALFSFIDIILNIANGNSAKPNAQLLGPCAATRDEGNMERKKGIVVSAACASLLLSSPAVVAYAAEPAGQSMISAASAQADESGFVIEDGVLTGYTGTATEIVIPDGVTEIASSVFEGHEEITSVTFPEGLTSIGDSAFEGCTGITEALLPDGLIELGSFAFGDIPGLRKVYIPASLNETFQPFHLGSWEVEASSELEVEFGEGITRIVDGLFLNASGLRSIMLPETVSEIGSQSFENSGLECISLPEGLVSIGDAAFSGCDDLAKITISGEASVESGVTFPSSLKYIGSSAFQWCRSIDELILPDGLLELGSRAFGDIPELRKIRIPASLERAFQPFYLSSEDAEPSSSLEVEFTGNFTRVPDSLFLNAGGLRSVKLPETVGEIGVSAFMGSGLEHITLPEELRSIEESAFEDCVRLSTVSIGDGDSVEIGMTFPSSLASIGRSAFRNCIGITELHLPEELVELGGMSFGGIPGLEKVYIPASLEIAGGAFYLSSWDVEQSPGFEVEFGDGVSRVVDNLFMNARGLREIELPRWVTEVGDSAFEGSGLESIALHNEFKSIGSCAFQSCESLRSIYIPASVTSIGRYAFRSAGGTGEDAFFIRCPSGSYAEAYAKENEIPYVIDDEHRHDFGEWELYAEATCDTARLERCSCSCGAYEERSVGEPLGHSFGDWIVDVDPTYNAEGSQHRECSRCHDSETQVLPKLEFSPEENPGYTQAILKVVDAESLEAVGSATVTITNDAGSSYSVTTDSSGSATIVAPAGTYDVLIEKEGYQPRGFERNLGEGSVTLPDIGIARESFAKGSLSVERMTQEEIEEAGIDTSAAGNNHIYRYEVTLRFDDGLEIPSVSYKTGDGKNLGGFLGDSSNKTSGGSGEYKHKDRNGITTRICQVNEYFYLVIRGEAKWQKEMFHVQLLVMNSSQTDQIVNATAELKLPEGLSLAEMTGAQQSTNVAVDDGTIDCGEQASVSWYVRGDSEGDYTLEATLSGNLSTFMDPFSYTYKTSEPIHVYAGTDMRLTVRASDSTAYLEPYTMFFELENVSDHSIYNVTHKVQNVSQYEVTEYAWVENGTVVDSVEEWKQLASDDLGPDGCVTAEEFKPGEKLVVMVTTTILWKSPLQTLKDNISLASDIGTLVGIATGTGINPMSLASTIMSYIDVRYFLTGAMVSTLEGSTAEIPTSFSISHDPSMRLIDKLVEKLIDKGEEGAAGLILNIMGLGGSADEIYDVSKVIGSQTSDAIEVASTDSDSKAHAWVETVSGEDVISLSIGGNSESRSVAPMAQEPSLTFTGNAELVVTGKNAGVADVVVEDESGNVARKRYYVRDEMPGQGNLIGEANDLYSLGFIPLPAGTIYSQDDADLYEYFGYELVVNGATPSVGSVIPTGASLREKDGSTEVPIVVLGDVTSDGLVDEKDLEALLSAASGATSLSGAQKSAGDLTGDDAIGQADADVLREFLNVDDVEEPDPDPNPDPDPDPDPDPTPGTDPDDGTVTNPDGTTTTTDTAEDGTVTQVTTDEGGSVVSVDVEVPESVAESGPVTLPIDGMAPSVEKDAPEISVSVPDDAAVTITVPLADGDGTDASSAVLVAVGPDGSATVLPKTALTEDGLTVTVEGSVTLKVVDGSVSFPDVVGSEWYASEVVPFISSRGIITGTYRDGIAYFDGNGRVTRGAFATMLHRLELEPASVECVFVDVAPGAWYEGAVSWGQEQGIIRGYDSAHYGPEDDLTREQLAALLMRYADWLGMDTGARADLSAFPDADEVSPYAREAVSWAVAEGLIRGDGGFLRPTGGAVRAEAAVVLMRFVELLYA